MTGLARTDVLPDVRKVDVSTAPFTLSLAGKIGTSLASVISM